MKCPYTTTVTTIEKQHYKFDDDGRQTDTIVTQTDSRVFVDCVGNDCGAWHNGRCCYYGSDEK